MDHPFVVRGRGEMAFLAGGDNAVLAPSRAPEKVRKPVKKSCEVKKGILDTMTSK